MADQIEIDNGRLPTYKVATTLLNGQHTSHVSPPILDPASEFEFALDTIGDGLGSTDMRVVGTLGTPIDFLRRFTNPEGAVVFSVTVAVADNGNKIEPGDYGTIANGLVNGIQILVLDTDGTTILNTFSTLPIQSNIGLLARARFPTRWEGQSSIAIVSRGMIPLPVRILQNQYMAVRIRDDCTSLEHHVSTIDGILGA